MKYQGRDVHLIDTPGFNDTYRTESTVLQEIAYWLTKSHESGVLLNGIIYLHSIAEPRYTASASKSLALLKAMSGPENYKAIILSTTFWDTNDVRTEDAREKQLISDFAKWGELKAGGSIVHAHSAGRTSGLAMINHIVQSDTKYTLAIQREMADRNTNLSDTTAGRILGDLWKDDIKHFQRQLENAKLDLQREAAAFQDKAKESVASLEAVIATRHADVAELGQTRNELHQHWEENMRQDMQRLQRAIDENQRSIAVLQQRRQEAERNGLSYAPEAMDEEDRLRQYETDLQQTKTTRLQQWGLGVNVRSMVSGGVSAALTAAPVIAQIVPLLALGSCNIM